MVAALQHEKNLSDKTQSHFGQRRVSADRPPKMSAKLIHLLKQISLTCTSTPLNAGLKSATTQYAVRLHDNGEAGVEGWEGGGGERRP